MDSYINCSLEGPYPAELCEQSLTFQDGLHSVVTSNPLSNLSFLNEPLRDFTLSEIESTFSSGTSDTNSRFQERYHPYSGHSSNVPQIKNNNCYGVERMHNASVSGNCYPGYHMSEGQTTGLDRTNMAAMVHQPFNTNNNNDHCGFYSVEAYQVPPHQQSVPGLPLQVGPPFSAPVNFRQPRTQGFNISSIPSRIMDTESSSSPDTEMSQETKLNEGKKRGVKKRRKRGTNEPQKPVSAYALFFRDTQAAIKAENPSATFGEISKIVASMWDSLSEEAKQVYKQKTETAKRDYLKQLASFRANLVSRGGLEGDEEDSQPLSMIKLKMNDNLPPPPKLQMAPTVAMRGFPPAESNNANATSPLSVHHIILHPTSTVATTTAPAPPPIQLRSIVPKSQSPITFLQSKPGQVIKLVPASQVATISGAGSDSKNRIIKMADFIRPSQTNNVQPILETLADEHNSLLHDSGRHEPQPAVASNGDAEYQTESVRVCIRDGCANLAVSDPQWNQEYCSSECVVRHCRDVFDAWTSARQVSASVN